MIRLMRTPRVAVTGAVALAALSLWAYLMVGWARLLF